VSLLSLLWSIALPWAAGALALRSLGNRRGDGASMLGYAGFGFFLGAALVAFGLRAGHALLGELSWWGVNALLLAVAAGAAWLDRRRGSPATFETPGSSIPDGARWLLALFALGVVAHVLLSAIEVVGQPVFPWDGWTVWVYRAKAWFYAGELAPMVNPRAWMSPEAVGSYTIPATAYPLLPSLLPLWSALGLGAWHETLVNLPVLACGIAIALGLTGALRAAGAGALAALAAAYLLLSTPLFGAHMSLGGYADIWLAGFAGLGMTAVLCGRITDRSHWTALGFALLALGTGVKVEGFVWLAAGIAVWAFSRLRPMLLVAVVTFVALIVGLAWGTGELLLDLPGIGRVGYREGLLFVPYKGIITLELHDVRAAYFDNAFLLGNWHLLWTGVLVALAVLATDPDRRPLRTALAFFAVFTGVQTVIFAFTTEGRWALDYTAINRMPLHMLPAVLFLLVLALSRGLTRLRDADNAAPGPRRLRAALAGGFATATLLGVLAVVMWQAAALPETRPDDRAIDPTSLRFVLGGGEASAAQVTVERYQDGIALLSSGAVDLDAGDYRFLRYHLDWDDDIASLDQAPAFFWRRKGEPRTVHRMTLVHDRLADLNTLPAWRGRIVEYGFFFVENRGAPATLAGVRLEAPDLGNRLALILRQWFTWEPWTQRSAHWLPGGAFDPVLPLAGFLAAVALLAAFLSWLFAGRRQGLACLVAALLTGWVLADARWLWERTRHADLVLTQMRDLSLEERLAEGELGRYSAYLAGLREEHFGKEPKRILIVPDPGDHKYYGLRAKYLLLPHATAVMRSLPPPWRLPGVDYVLFLGDFTWGAPPDIPGERPGQRWRRLGVEDRPTRHRLRLVDATVQGTLFEVVEPPWLRD